MSPPPLRHRPVEEAPVTTTPQAPRFGVNYTPSAGWFHHWLDFDLDAVRATAMARARLREAGLGEDALPVLL